MLTHAPVPQWSPAPDRYTRQSYARSGRSGLRLPQLSLGLWQNFGAVDGLANARAMLQTAFDLGITHFDLANNYGPPYGAAESTFGQAFAQDFRPYRDEILVSSKAGFDMWAGPYGIGGSRKYLIASCDQSLSRTGLDYFDIFYHHCPDPETPLEETMAALDHLVRAGKALYVGVSNYGPELTRAAQAILRDLGTPMVIHQPRYNLLDRKIEAGLTDVLMEEGIGAICYSPMAQGLLSDKYLAGIPAGSRAARQEIVHFNRADISPERLAQVGALNEIARARGQSLAQMALAWVLSHPAVTSCLIGARNPDQIRASFSALERREFSAEEKAAIDALTL
jgi:L-glyceraldehyde 3-phosphate reductase